MSRLRPVPALALAAGLSACGPRAAAPPSERIVDPPAPEAPAPTGVWSLLVQPGARWILTNRAGDAPNERDRVFCEVVEVRQVAGTAVARLVWTWDDGTSSGSKWLTGQEPLPEQVAVDERGVWIVSAGADDRLVAATLAQPPTFTDPPVPILPDAGNGGRYLRITERAGAPLYCWGHEPAAGQACDDDAGCRGEICLWAGHGPLSISGAAAPEGALYVLAGESLS